MKTTEEKAKAYDNVVGKLKRFMAQGVDPLITRADVQDFFPEVKESEDERIRKGLISYLRLKYENPNAIGYDYGKWLAWLEKQGEKKDSVVDFKANDWYVSKADGKIHNICHSVDNVESKFKVGDWVVSNTNKDIFLIKSVNTEYYTLEDTKGRIYSPCLPPTEDDYHLWTIEDAKDGDVLATEAFVFIFKAIREDKGVGYYCANENELYEGDDSTFHVANPNSLMGSINNDFTHYTPATKEQRDLLFQKMKEAGYEWDADKKELKKIDSYCENHCKGYQETGKCFADGECKAKKEANQKPAWSEEDERNFQGVIDEIEANKHSAPDYDLATYDMFLSWLKSLKDRYTWKPSEEQMADLWNMVCECRPAEQQLLQDIYYGLKTLRGE